MHRHPDGDHGRSPHRRQIERAHFLTFNVSMAATLTPLGVSRRRGCGDPGPIGVLN
jgi:hypothetical protein